MVNWWDNYELTPRKSELKECAGLYILICKPTGQVYVGSGENVAHRIRQHYNALVKRKHVNTFLQAAWNEHGQKSIDWQIIQETPGLSQSERFELEERLIRSYPVEMIFNLVYPLGGAISRKGIKSLSDSD